MIVTPVAAVRRSQDSECKGRGPLRTRPQDRRFSDAEESAIANAYRQGLTVEQLRRLKGCTNRTIADALRRQGVTLRVPGARGDTAAGALPDFKTGAELGAFKATDGRKEKARVA